MRKNLIIILLLFTTIISYSQTGFGFFAGMNRTILTKDFLEKPQFELDKSNGIHIGAVYRFELNDNFSFNPKFSISQQGYIKDFSTDKDVKPTYLNIPLNFRFFKKTYLLIGPQIGYILNKKRLKDIYPDINSFDYGANIGLGREIKNLFVEFNLYRGLKNPFNGQYRVDGKNTVFQLSLGYKLK